MNKHRVSRRRSAAATLLSSFALVGASVGFAARAEASPLVDNYVSAFGGIVCANLDDYPTIAGVYGTGLVIAEDGFTYFEAGMILRQSVTYMCPWHTALLDRFVDVANGNAGSVHA